MCCWSLAGSRFFLSVSFCRCCCRLAFLERQCTYTHRMCTHSVHSKAQVKRFICQVPAFVLLASLFLLNYYSVFFPPIPKCVYAFFSFEYIVDWSSSFYIHNFRSLYSFYERHKSVRFTYGNRIKLNELKNRTGWKSLKNAKKHFFSRCLHSSAEVLLIAVAAAAAFFATLTIRNR